MRKLLFILFLWPAFAICEQVALSDLVRHADIQEIKISPTGSHLAVKKLYEGERMLVFMSINPLKITGTLRFRGKEEVGDFFWANNERVVAEVMSRKAALEAPVFYGSLFAINYDGTKGKNIFGHLAGERQVGSRFKKAETTYAHATLIDPLLDREKEILVSTHPWANNQESIGEVLRLNIYNGVKKRISRLPQAWGRAYTDQNGNLLFANGTTEEGISQLFFRSKQGWERVGNPLLDTATPIGFDSETGESYLSLTEENQTEKFIRLKPGSNKYSVIYQHKISDIHGVIRAPGSYKPLGIYLHPDYPQEKFFSEDEGFAAFFRGLKKVFDGYHIFFTSFTSDGTLGILEVQGDRLPSDYFLVNMKSKSVDFLISSANWLNPKQLNPMMADAFTTEDGLRVGVYLTFPKGSKKNHPMVVLPHGGPHARDYWGYNQEAQILSQNGYLVLQVNFRGSTGYGDAFYTAGEREWGGKIQKDIADAVNWAVEKGYADPERVCIYGASFGGYSALMNPIRYPDLYKCAIGYAGVYDLEMMYTKGDIKRRDRGIAYLRRELSKDENFLRDNSPIHNTDKLNIPLFIIHGEKDERVPVEHAEELLEKLEKEGKPARSLIVANEGHGFYSEDNNMKLYTELLAFLDEHIGVGSVEKQPAVKQ
ncbi:alpha/beta hydrolase family protein [Microbulbifer variabilis]|uniref:alpha/beta hydrolase family protein n=1 Tax=Microbulbifer variabilis TaxID=266805 RepID=UPI001CFE99B0|nr:prolyl oligopeptidase family serine peptidase [Microbulbifer variabilis]